MSQTLDAIGRLGPGAGAVAWLSLTVGGGALAHHVGCRTLSPGHRPEMPQVLAYLGAAGGLLDPLLADHPKEVAGLFALGLLYVEVPLRAYVSTLLPPTEVEDRLLIGAFSVPLLMGAIFLILTPP